jgi:tRNA threonylcarbamoyladenosine biosynthesis protein TsaE
MTLIVVSPATQDTHAIGEAIGARLITGDLICLSGDLGAGKTALARGIGMGWGAVEPVSSPTFVMIHEHHREVDSALLLHVDAYRFTAQTEAFTIGLEDLFDTDAVVLLEWAERVTDLLPPERLWLDIEPQADESRRITFLPTGSRAEALTAALTVALSAYAARH